jgi:hypothetical protein
MDTANNFVSDTWQDSGNSWILHEPEVFINFHATDSFHLEMVDFGSGQGRRLFATTGVAALRRGLQKDENADPGRKMPFLIGNLVIN